MVGWPMGSLPVGPRLTLPVSGQADGADEAREPANACDPDRRGGAILTRIRMAMGVDEPVSRPWVVSLDERTIRGARAEAGRSA